ncbi:MAG: hypothetical protein SGPRY_009796, partial [Prymnesium sp.]
ETHKLIEELCASRPSEIALTSPRLAGYDAQGEEVGRLVEGLLQVVGERVGPSLCERWSSIAIRHGWRTCLSKVNAGVARVCLLTYKAMVPILSPPLLPCHARSLMNIACRCALSPTAATVQLACAAMEAVRAILICSEGGGSEARGRDGRVLSDVFWRGATLLYTEYTAVYAAGAALLTTALTLRPLSDPTLLDELSATIPPFWPPPPPSSRREEGEDLGTTFPGLQPLLLKGLGRRTTRAACVRLMRLAAMQGPSPNPFWEGERTRLLTCTAALLPWLSSLANGAVAELSIAESCRPEWKVSERSTNVLAHEEGGMMKGGEGQTGRRGGLVSNGGVESVVTGKGERPPFRMWNADGGGGAVEVIGGSLADSLGVAARGGRGELLSLAIVLHNQASKQYQLGEEQFWCSLAAALSHALSVQPGEVVYGVVTTLICGVGLGPGCGGEILSLACHIISSCRERGPLASPEAACCRPPPPQLWQSLVEISLEVPSCANQLKETIRLLLAACAEGALLPPSLVRWQPSGRERERERVGSPSPSKHPRSNSSSKRRRRREMGLPQGVAWFEDSPSNLLEASKSGAERSSPQVKKWNALNLNHVRHSQEHQCAWVSSSEGGGSEEAAEQSSDSGQSDRTSSHGSNMAENGNEQSTLGIRQPRFEGGESSLQPRVERVDEDSQAQHFSERLEGCSRSLGSNEGGDSSHLESEAEEREDVVPDDSLDEEASLKVELPHAADVHVSSGKGLRKEAFSNRSDHFKLEELSPRIPFSPSNSNAPPDDKFAVHVWNNAWINVSSRRRSSVRARKGSDERENIVLKPTQNIAGRRGKEKMRYK